MRLSILNVALARKIGTMNELSGKTAILVDVSASMDWPLSKRSDMKCIDVAAGLASIVPCEKARVFSFSYKTKEVNRYFGLAGVTAIKNSQPHGGTYLGASVSVMNELAWKPDRLIVITDEQSHDHVPDPVAEKAYMINVASAKNGVGYGRWIHIDGFSENVIRFIEEFEANN